MKIKCRNCGAPIHPNSNRCPSCGMRYVVLDEDKPAYFRVNLKNGAYFEMLATMTNPELNTEYTSFFSTNTELIATFNLLNEEK